MTAPEVFSFDEFGKRFEGRELVFIGRISFEKRSITAYKILQRAKIIKRSLFSSLDEADEARRVRDEAGLPEGETIFLNTSDPLQVQSGISSEVSKLNLLPGLPIVVDITTFRKEELLILIRELSTVIAEAGRKIYFIYTKAASMGEWLSNSVVNVRPVIGYPGDIQSVGRTHLILMAGIEHHRAKAIIEAYEPFSVSLGMVPQEESVSDSIYEKNLELRNYLKLHYDQIRTEFDFSATDLDATVRRLTDLSAGLSEFNVVVAPLNNKISTLAAAIFAMKNPRIQLCYAEVDSYNTASYSEQGNEIMLLNCGDVTSFC